MRKRTEDEDCDLARCSPRTQNEKGQTARACSFKGFLNVGIELVEKSRKKKKRSVGRQLVSSSPLCSTHCSHLSFCKCGIDNGASCTDVVPGKELTIAEK
jgi:hypothetical protein